MTHPIDDQHDDDQPVGRILNRREILALLGGAGAAAFASLGLVKIDLSQLAGTATPTPTASATALPGCVVKPAMTEGPYFVDALLNRSDIRIEPSDESMVEGMLLKLTFRVMDVTEGTCKPLQGAQVDVWHADANGIYSGVNDPGFDTSDKLFLRGYQVTDENGEATFITIYPGWYSGRAVHIHFKIRTDPQAQTGYEFTSQLFFDEELTDIVHAQAPYNKKGRRNTFNDTDNIYGQSGDALLLSLEEMSAQDAEAYGAKAGYSTVFEVGLDLNNDTSAQSEFTQPTGGMGGGRGGMGGMGQPPNGTPPARP